MNCTFTTNIAEELDCDPKGNFDDYGFPIKRCPLYPCPEYIKLRDEINQREAERLARLRPIENKKKDTTTGG